MDLVISHLCVCDLIDGSLNLVTQSPVMVANIAMLLYYAVSRAKAFITLYPISKFIGLAGMI